jgi:GR25 family glycosyltransferase involved in LPS biosynthesis
MNLSPVLLFTYNRPFHTRQTLEALEKNYLAQETHLIIFLDGLKDNCSSEQAEHHNQLRLLLNEKKWCRTVEIFESETNLGCAKSIVNGVTEALKSHNKVIILEDDIVTSPYFLTYMNDGLNYYEKDLTIGSINSFAERFLGDSRFPEYFLMNGSDSWGWGTWRDRWKDFIFDAKIVKDKIIQLDKIDEFEFGSHMTLIDQQIVGSIDTWDVQWHGSNIIAGRKGLYPKTSFLRNIGLDGSGTHGEKINKHNDPVNIALNEYKVSFNDFVARTPLKYKKSIERRYKRTYRIRFSSSLKKRIINKLSHIYSIFLNLYKN